MGFHTTRTVNGPIRQMEGIVRVAVTITRLVKTPLVDIIVVEQPLMVVKHTALVMDQVLPQPQLIPSVQHHVLSIV